jgi:hypothetical protein
MDYLTSCRRAKSVVQLNRPDLEEVRQEVLLFLGLLLNFSFKYKFSQHHSKRLAPLDLSIADNSFFEKVS